MGNLIEYRCGLIDFQVGRDHGKLNFDPAEYVKSCARSNIKRVMFTCKDAYGDAYYRSDLVEQNPMAADNYLQTAIDEAKKLNMELYAYCNIFLDDIYAEAHPEQRIINTKGEKVIAYDYYKSLCPNSPYADVIKKRIAELVFNYDIDGIFFDITYFQSSNCFCEHCKVKFFQIFGYELKNSIQPGSAEYADFNKFKRMTRAEILMNLADTVREYKTIPVIWNGSGSFYLAEPEVDEYSDYLTTEFHAPDYLDGIVRAKWMQSRGQGFIMSTPCELGSWGDWTMIPKSTLRSTVCSIAAHGGGVFFNHTPCPSGEFASSHTKCIEDNINESFIYLEEYEEHLRNTISAADTAVIFSINSKRFCENGFAGYSLSDYTASLKGAVRMMLESGTPFDVIDEETFIKDPKRYELTIIPESPELSDEFTDVLESYSGRIIACGSTGLYTEYGDINSSWAMSKLMGVRYDGFNDISVEYMSDILEEISEGVPKMPILIKNAGRLVKIKSVDSIMLSEKTVPPFEAAPDRHVYHQHAHPYKRTGYASITRKNMNIFFSADIFRSYTKTASPWLKRIFRNCVELLHPNPVLKISAPVCVYPTLLRKDSRYILQLMNINGAIYETGKSFPEEVMCIPEVDVLTNLNAKDIFLPAGKKKVDSTANRGYTRFILKDCSIHTIAIIDTEEL